MNTIGSRLEHNLFELQQEILQVCSRCGRDPRTVKLLAVSKGQSPEKIRSLYELGQSSFGENYVQELKAKWQKLKDLEMEWHFIGTLQSNKVKDLVGRVSWIHSLDRLSLLQAVAKRAREANVVQKVLLEVNFAGEQSKSGCPESEIVDLLSYGESQESIELGGIMVMPPLTEAAEQIRPIFSLARKRLEEWRRLLRPERQERFRHLSMGTSHDYAIAIEEGATMIRIGTRLMGERDKGGD